MQNRTSAYDSLFEWKVANKLAERGYHCVPQVSVGPFFIDLGVPFPGDRSQWLAGVECDGWAYHNTPGAASRDRWRQRKLETEYSWRILRIGSKEFFGDSDRAMDKLCAGLRELERAHHSAVSLDRWMGTAWGEADTEMLRRLYDTMEPRPEGVPYRSIRRHDASFVDNITLQKAQSMGFIFCTLGWIHAGRGNEATFEDYVKGHCGLWERQFCQ